MTFAVCTPLRGGTRLVVDWTAAPAWRRASGETTPAGVGKCRARGAIVDAQVPRVRRRDEPLYVALTLAWLLLSVLMIGVALQGAVGRVDEEFRNQAESDIETLRDRLRTNEGLLAGFVAFLDTVDAPANSQLAAFSARLLQDNPHIFMLEVVDKVTASSRAAFEARLSAQVGGAVRIGRFDYDGERTWEAAAEKPLYYPVSFIWPDSPGSRPVLGLDLDSVPHLRETLQRADRSDLPVSSPPFVLVEGPLAYVMMRRAGPVRPDPVDARAQRRPERYALMVVKAESLLPAHVDEAVSYTLRAIGNRGLLDPPLYAVPAAVEAVPLERRLFEESVVDTVDFSTSQPVRLTLRRQLRFADIGLGRVALAGLVSAMALLGLVVFIERHRTQARIADEDHLRARYGALHDPLTGLPNRRLLYDRIEQALAQWRRSGEGFALFFLDLDRFKDINDSHGHEAGDLVLQTVAQRLGSSMRATDTVSRISGDEFVILLPGMTERGTLEVVAGTILQVIAQPVALRDGVAVEVRASLGISMCPDDGNEPDALIRAADRAMYRIKSRHETPPGSGDGPVGTRGRRGADGRPVSYLRLVHKATPKRSAPDTAYARRRQPPRGG